MLGSPQDSQPPPNEAAASGEPAAHSGILSPEKDKLVDETAAKVSPEEPCDQESPGGEHKAGPQQTTGDADLFGVKGQRPERWFKCQFS